MKAVLQRVSKARVKIKNRTIAKIGPGYLILLGIHKNDTGKNADSLAQKIINLRLMSDKNNKMNLSLGDSGGEILVVSQFTLLADTSSRRPGFTQAAPPDKAKILYRRFITQLKQGGVVVKEGLFGAYMHLSLTNDGPVTIILNL